MGFVRSFVGSSATTRRIRWVVEINRRATASSLSIRPTACHCFPWSASQPCCPIRTYQTSTLRRIRRRISVKKQELSYRKQIARQLCTHYVEGICKPNYPVTLKSRLRVTQGQEPLDRSYTTYYLLIELFDVEYYRDLKMWVRGHSRSLKLVSGVIWKLGCGFIFAFFSNYGRICSRLWDIQRQIMVWPWKHTHSLTIVDLPRWGLATADDHSDIFLLHCARSCDISFSWMYSQPVHSPLSSRSALMP